MCAARAGVKLLTKVGPGPLLALAAAVPFWQLLGADFLGYDDPLFLLRLPFWSDPSLSTLGDIWARPIYGSYHPLHQTSYFLDRVVWGKAAWGIRCTNLLLYAGILIGFCAVGRRLRLPPAAIFLGGLLYAWHPSHVENVAWLSQRKDLLSALFLLAAFAVYLGPQPHALRGADPPLPSWPRVAATAALFACGLLSKSVTVVLLPWLVLLALGRRSLRREASRLGALALLGVGATLVHYFAQDAVGATVVRPPAAEHAARLARALGHYAFSFAAPLSPAPRLPLDLGWTAPQALGLGLCAAWLACSWRWASARTWGLMAWAGIGPMWGLVPLPTFVQDRYLLWATLPLCWALGAGLAHLGRARRARTWVVVVGVGLGLGELAIAYPYAATWRTERALWTANVEAYPDLPEPREMLLRVYDESRDPAQRQLALRMAQEILAVAPSRVVPNLLLARRARQARDFDAARAHYLAAADATGNLAYQAPLLLAELELDLDDLPAARAALELAGPPRSPPDAPEVLAGWAAWHLAAGDPAEAGRLAARAAAALPGWLLPRELRARAARRRGDAALAWSLLETLDPATRARIGVFLHLEAHELDAAEALLRDTDPRDLEFELARACLEAHRGDHAGARARRANLLTHATPGGKRRVRNEPTWPL